MRMIRLRRPAVCAVALVVAAVAALLGAGRGIAVGQSRLDTLIIAHNIDDYVTNDPGWTYEFTSQMLDRSAYDTLVTVEAPDFTKIMPKLATAWEIPRSAPS